MHRMYAPSSPELRPATRRARSAAPLVALLLAGCGALWQGAALPEVSARGAIVSPGVLELEADRDFGEAWAKVLTPDGRAEVAQCESVPCRAVLPQGRYHVVVGSGSLVLWIDAYHAELDTEITACVTDRVRVALPARIGSGRGKIVRHDRVWLASDPRRTGEIPPGCAAAPDASPPPVTYAPR
jgi:hypothetical protein